MSELDQCSVCGGVHLVRRLGEIECRDCGMVCDPADAGSVAGPAEVSGGVGGDRAESGHEPGSLADDVERALERVLGRSRRTAGIR
jgi:hypothetical protein